MLKQWNIATEENLNEAGKNSRYSDRGSKPATPKYKWCFDQLIVRTYRPLSFEISWSQGPSGLRRVSATDRLLGLRVRIPSGAWISVSCKCVCCQRSLRRADHSSRGGLPTVVCYCVWSRNLSNEAVLVHVGLLRQGGRRRRRRTRRIRIRSHSKLYKLWKLNNITNKTVSFLEN